MKVLRTVVSSVVFLVWLACTSLVIGKIVEFLMSHV